MKIAIILFLVLIPVVSAQSCGEIVDDICDTNILSFLHDLIYPGSYRPDIQEQSDGHIYAWIDIVGFKNMSYKDGEYQINGNPAEDVLICSKKWDTVPLWNCGVDTFEETITCAVDGLNIIATMNIYLKWHRSQLKLSPYPHIKKTYYQEYLTITDTDQIPKQSVHYDFNQTYADVVIYNNSVSPKTTVCACSVPDSVLSIDYCYDTDCATHYLYTGVQEYTAKNVPYMNISAVDTWKRSGNLSYLGNHAIIPHDDFNISNLTVTINTADNIYNVSNISVEIIQWRGTADTFTSLFVWVLVISGVFLGGAYIQIRRLRYRT